MDDDFVVLGYIRKDGGMRYQGHVTLGVDGEKFRQIANRARAEGPPCPVVVGNENAGWIAPDLVCRVEFMYRSVSGAMRQPVFRTGRRLPR